MSQSRVLLENRSVGWLLGGGLISMIGDHFTLIALPWLVLRITGDPLAMGAVMATIATPRALLMVVGGAIVDRSSPKTILIVTKLINAVLLSMLAGAVVSRSFSMELIYVLAFAIGTASAFGFPAGSAILPQVVEPGQLHAANAFLMGMRQITQLIVPLAAGILIATFGDGGAGSAVIYAGLAAAFALDAASFIISAATLTMVKTRWQDLGSARPPERLFASIGQGLAAFWRDSELRTILVYSSATTLVTAGAVQVALPLLSARNVAGGSVAYGAMLAAYAAGSLMGLTASGRYPAWQVRNLGTTILLADAIAAVLLYPLGAINHLWQGIVLLIGLGVVGGLIQVRVFTWIQQRVEPPMIGRAMSVLMLIFVGLTPISAAVTGWLLTFISTAEFFIYTGITLGGVVVGGVLTNSMRKVGGLRSTLEAVQQNPASR
jgi:hypothetical protein